MKNLQEVLTEIMETGTVDLKNLLEIIETAIIMWIWNQLLSDRPEDEIEKYRRKLPNVRRITGFSKQHIKDVLNRNGIDTSGMTDEE